MENKFNSVVDNVYKIGVNGMWEIRPAYIISFVGGLIGMGLTLSSFIIKEGNIMGFIISFILFIPFFMCIAKINYGRKYGRSKRYYKKINKLILKNNLTIDDTKLIEEMMKIVICNNIVKRNIIIKFNLSFFKFLVIPIIIASIKFMTINSAVLIIITSMTVVFTLSIIMWSDNETIEDYKIIGIKNSYKYSVVKRELVFYREQILSSNM